MESVAKIERRGQPRHPISLEVFISPNKVSHTRLASRITNMSLLGCAIEPNAYDFQEKEKLSICFVASREQCSMSTIIQAEVAHVAEDYIGLSFAAMGSNVMDLLRGLLKDARYF